MIFAIKADIRYQLGILSYNTLNWNANHGKIRRFGCLVVLPNVIFTIMRLSLPTTSH